ncbi:hypothetical protein [Staphylococcus chromogenes]|uniref:hypothetical protein n=1 Tax=Staphylococcus chromogenes TaxID=46126 RepID=UPI001F547C6B|nr:hypothetical protein [Staphylococcus chromogenes]
MRKEYWAHKALKKTASIIKKDILITNQSGQVIDASKAEFLGLHIRLRSIQFNEMYPLK